MNTLEFLNALYDRVNYHPLNHFKLHVVPAPHATGRPHVFRAALPFAAQKQLRIHDLNDAGNHIYFTPIVHSQHHHIYPALWADFDASDFAGNKDAALKQLHRSPIPASIIVDTGHGFHAYWVLDNPILSSPHHTATFTRHLRAIAAHLHSDATVARPTACMRLPGTLNHKEHPPLPCKVISPTSSSTPHTYPLTQFTTFPDPPAPSSATTSPHPEHPHPTDTDPAGYWLAQALERVARGAPRNNTGFWLACQLRDAGIPQSEARATLILYAHRVPQDNHPYLEREALSSLRSAYRRRPRQPAHRIHETLYAYLTTFTTIHDDRADYQLATTQREIRRLRGVVRTQTTLLTQTEKDIQQALNLLENQQYALAINLLTTIARRLKEN